MSCSKDVKEKERGDGHKAEERAEVRCEAIHGASLQGLSTDKVVAMWSDCQTPAVTNNDESRQGGAVSATGFAELYARVKMDREPAHESISKNAFSSRMRRAASR